MRYSCGSKRGHSVVRYRSIGLLLSLALVLPVCAQTPAGSSVATPNAAQRPPRPATPAAGRNTGGRPLHNEADRAARWKPVAMPYVKTGLTLRERQMIAKLADACHLMDELYWHSTEADGTRRIITRRLLARSRWCPGASCIRSALLAPPSSDTLWRILS